MSTVTTINSKTRSQKLYRLPPLVSLGVNLDGRGLDRGDSGSRLRFVPPRSHQVGWRLLHACRCVLGRKQVQKKIIQHSPTPSDGEWLFVVVSNCFGLQISFTMASSLIMSNGRSLQQ
jgi:hypothetical protein